MRLFILSICLTIIACADTSQTPSSIDLPVRVMQSGDVPSPTPSPTPVATETPMPDLMIAPAVVELSTFALGTYPVTCAEYKAAVDAGVVDAPPTWADAPDFASIENLPVTYVTPESAALYVAWLTAQDATYAWSVATVEQWLEGAGSDVYPYGNDPAVLADININWQGPVGVEPVGSRTEDVTALGLHDMCGNVSEFTSSRWDNDFGWIVKGGNAYSGLDTCTTAWAGMIGDNNWGGAMGFRVARVAK